MSRGIMRINKVNGNLKCTSTSRYSTFNCLACNNPSRSPYNSTAVLNSQPRYQGKPIIHSVMILNDTPRFFHAWVAFRRTICIEFKPFFQWWDRSYGSRDFSFWILKFRSKMEEFYSFTHTIFLKVDSLFCRPENPLISIVPKYPRRIGE